MFQHLTEETKQKLNAIDVQLNVLKAKKEVVFRDAYFPHLPSGLSEAIVRGDLLVILATEEGAEILNAGCQDDIPLMRVGSMFEAVHILRSCGANYF